MGDADIKDRTESSSRTWVAAVVATVAFLLWALFIFFAVGVKWPPAWDFGAIPDVPGLSVYSTHPPKAGVVQSAASLREGDKLAPQHVKDPPMNYSRREQSE